jgi:hypothetical protein
MNKFYNIQNTSSNFLDRFQGYIYNNDNNNVDNNNDSSSGGNDTPC